MNDYKSIARIVDELFTAIWNSDGDFESIAVFAETYLKDKFADFNVLNYKRLQVMLAVLRGMSWTCRDILAGQNDEYFNEIMKG